MKTLLVKFFLAGLMLAFIATAAHAQTQAGLIKAARITGTVSKVNVDGSLQTIADGTLLTENDTVVTGANSGVVLVFMNGSSVKLGAASRIAIEEFKMDPLAEDIAVAKLTGEPSVSKTVLNLTYGEMIGDVKKLNKSSSYSIKTPAGAAGIRGTTFRIIFTPSQDGRTYTFTLSTAEGVVVFSGTAGTPPVEVSASREVVVQADVDANGNASNVQVQTQGISTEASETIQTAITNAIAQAQAESVFSQYEQQAGSNNNNNFGPKQELNPITHSQSAPTTG